MAIKVNGTDVINNSRAIVNATGYNGINPTPDTRTITTGTGLTGGGNLTANRTLSIDRASEAEARAGTDNTHVMTPLRVRQADLFQTFNLTVIGQGVSLQNTRGRYIFITPTVLGNNDSGRSKFDLQISENNSNFFHVSSVTTHQNSDHFGMSTIVPTGWYWRVLRVHGGNTAAVILFGDFS